MITCEWGWVGIPQIKRCVHNARYVVKFEEGRPIAMPFFGDYSFVCGKHLRQLLKRKVKIDVYELREYKYKEMVQFT
jgi:hypothetical protein